MTFKNVLYLLLSINKAFSILFVLSKFVSEFVSANFIEFTEAFNTKILTEEYQSDGTWVEQVDSEIQYFLIWSFESRLSHECLSELHEILQSSFSEISSLFKFFR